MTAKAEWNDPIARTVRFAGCTIAIASTRSPAEMRNLLCSGRRAGGIATVAIVQRDRRCSVPGNRHGGVPPEFILHVPKIVSRVAGARGVNVELGLSRSQQDRRKLTRPGRLSDTTRHQRNRLLEDFVRDRVANPVLSSRIVNIRKYSSRRIT